MRKLFYEDINITDFEGTVISCEYDDKKKLYSIVLDATAFFPEEGGQSADIGTLAGQEVADVQIKDDLIYHYVKEPVETGAIITGHVDFTQRFDFMQQHTGEHIISGMVHTKYGYNNVGFHLSVNEVTLDFDGVLDWSQLREIESEANKVIYQNLPIQISYPSKEELPALTYRSKIEIDGQVRLVTIPDVDVCACCAPHVAYTGQIGIIKITQVQSYKGGVRLHILCGERALKDYTTKQDSVVAIAQELSAKQEQVTDAFFKLKSENQSLKEKLNDLQAKYLDLSLSSLPSPETSENAVLFTDINDNIAIRNAVNTLMERYSGYSVVFTGEEGSYRFIVGSKTKDCAELAQKIRTELGAKCGGNKLMIQGSVDSKETTLRNIFLV